MRILLCGGSWTTSRALVYNVLDLVSDEVDVTGVVVPLQYGVDRWATQWGKKTNVPVWQIPIPTGTRKRERGAVRRDDEMFARTPGMVVAIGKGSGSKRIVSRAKAAGIPTATFDEEMGALIYDGLALLMLQDRGPV